MQKTYANRITFLSLLIFMSIMCFLSITIFSHKTSNVFAADTTSPLNIQFGTIDNDNDTFTPDANNATITDGKFLLLESNDTNDTTPAINITVGKSNNNLCDWLNITIARNDTNIATNATEEVNKSNTSTKYMTFEQTIKINNTTTGKYEISLTYRLLVDGATDIERTDFVTFYVYTYDEYTQMNDQPTLDNIVPLVNPNNSSYYKQFAYFYKNTGTYGAVDVSSTTNPETSFSYEAKTTDNTKVLFPSITFNPEHYLLTIERVLYKTVETTTMSFTATASNRDSNEWQGELLLNTTLNGKISAEKITVPYNTDTNTFTITLPLTKVGEYKITKKFVRYDSLTGTQNGVARTYNTIDPSNVKFRFQGSDPDNSNHNITLPEYIAFNGYQTHYTPEYGQTAVLYKDNGNDTIYSPNYGYKDKDDIITNKPTTKDNIDKVKTLLSNLKSETTNILPSTNLGPISFDYLGTINTGKSWYVRVDNFGNATVHDFTLGMEFSNAGTYYIHLDIKPVNKSLENFSQIICFTINNTPTKPIVKITDNDNDNTNDITLGVGKYTNKAIYIDWNEPGPFDADINVQYTCDTSYSPVSTYAPSYSNTYQKGSLLSENGIYYVRLIKNNDVNTATYTFFYIDNNPITGIKALECNNKTVLPNTVLSTQEQFNLTVSSPFVWTWADKQSGASIEFAKYFYAPITAIDGFKLPTEGIDNDKDLLVTVNAELSNFSYPADYTRWKSNSDNTINNQSQLINTPQLAVLLLCDEAGNTTIFMTIYDNIQPYIIQTPAKSNAQNIITDNTDITWGSHKAINIQSNSDLYNMLNGSTSISQNQQFEFTNTSIKYNNNNFNLPEDITESINNSIKSNYLTIPIHSVRVNITPVDGSSQNLTLSAQEYKTARVIVEIQGVGGSEYTQTYLQYGNNTSEKFRLDNDSSANECLYQFNCSDVRNNTSSLNLKVNLDQTRGTFYAHKNTRANDQFGANDTQSIFKAINQTYSTNRNYVTFAWKKPDNSIQIEYITLDYYQLNYDEQSPNYPYSANPINATIYHKDNINTGFHSTEIEGSTHYQTVDLQKLSTGSAVGKYVFTRKYTDEFANQNSETTQGDVMTKVYTYYVDRSNILDKSNLGNDTSIDFGYAEYTGFAQNPYSNRHFTDFSKNFTDENFERFLTGHKSQGEHSYVRESDVMVSGNLAPVGISTFIQNQTVNKFLNKTSSELQYNVNADTTINIGQSILNNYKNFANIIIVVQYYQTNSGGPTSTHYYSHITNGDYQSFAKLQEAFVNLGRYRVIMFDTCNSNYQLSGNFNNDINNILADNDRPNYSIMTFGIKSTPPEMLLQKKAEGDEEYSNLTISHSITSTNSDNIRVSFVEPSADFMAKIGTINLNLQYSKYGTIYKELTTTLSINTSNITEYTNNAPADNAKLYYTNLQDGRKQYYVVLPKSLVSQTTTYDCICEITVSYIREDNEFVVNTETPALSNIYSTTYTVNIDKTAPYENLHDLINNDPNISILNSINSGFQAKIKNNIDNPDNTFLQQYAFQIPTDYKFTKAQDADDDFFYKKYTDYTGLINQQTVVPNTPAFQMEENASRRFSETATEIYHSMAYSAEKHLTQPGYYDIIERDKVGNYRVYTVFVCDQSANLSISHDNIPDSYILDLGTTTKWSTNTPADKIINNIDIYNNLANINFANIHNSTIQPQWQIVSVINNITGTKTYYLLLPLDITSNNANYLHQFTSMRNVTVVHSIEALNSSLNDLIESLATTNINTTGSSLTFDVFNNLSQSTLDTSVTPKESFTIRTPGVKIVETLEDINLSIDTKNNTFSITLPYNTVSTEISQFVIIRNGAQTVRQDFKGNNIVNKPGKTYTFALNNVDFYQFLFTDNFGRTTDLRYPIDDSTLKELRFSGNTLNWIKDGTTYTYTSSNVDFVYDSVYNIVRIRIVDFDTGKELYYNSTGVLDNNSEFYKYTRDEITHSTFTISFLPHDTYKHLYYHIQVGMTESNLYDFKFVYYLKFPEISLTDKDGAQLWAEGTKDRITGKTVKVSWEAIQAEFNPIVRVSKNNVDYSIESGTELSEEGTYRIYLKNDIGIFNAKEIVFTIKKYDISVYGVYQENSLGELISLISRDKAYPYQDDSQNITMLTEFFFLGDDWSKIRVFANEDKQLQIDYIQINDTRVYTITGNGSYKISLRFAVTRIPVNHSFLLVDNFAINGKTQRDSFMNIIPTATTTDEDMKAEITWNSTYTTTDGERTIPNFYYLELIYNNDTSNPIIFYSGSITLNQAGKYVIKIRDIVGQTQKFGTAYNYDTFTLTIYKDVIFTVNNSSAIQNAIYNNDVTIAVTDFSKYITRNFAFNVTKNNLPYEAIFTNGQFTFTEPGVYNVSMSGTLANTGTNAKPLTASYQFTILPTNEARQYFEFTPLTGYTITEIKKRSNLTDDPTSQNYYEYLLSAPNYLHSLVLSTDNEYGAGMYTITITVAAQQFLPERQFTFSLWINKSQPVITPSRDWGSAAIAGFDLVFNPLSIYERIGNCYLTVNGQKVYTFDDETIANLTTEDPVYLKYTQQGDYIIQLYSASGNLITSNRLTINEPFNTAAIVLIVLFVLLVVGGIIVFVVLRNKMKVR